MIPLTPGATWLTVRYIGSPDNQPHAVMFILLSTSPWTFLVSTRRGEPEVWLPGSGDAVPESYILYLFEHAKKIL